MVSLGSYDPPDELNSPDLATPYEDNAAVIAEAKSDAVISSNFLVGSYAIITPNNYKYISSGFLR